MRRPGGQVLAAVLLFFMAFTVLFALLYRSGIAYSMKARAVRGSDLTALSCGSVYAEGLHLVRLSNVILMSAAALDLFTMVDVFISSGGPATVPASTAAALAADPGLRKRVQDAQAIFFGIAREGREEPLGVYPFLIHAGGLAAASDNALEIIPPLSPLILYNPETTEAIRSVFPGMALRFRTADELLPETRGQDENPACHRLRDTRSGRWVYFRPEQLEPAPGAHANQFRVRCDLPSPYRCKYVETCGASGVTGRIPGLAWALKRLGDVLKRIRLDVTHRDEPPMHTVLVGARLKAHAHDDSPLGHASETRIVGSGLAAWDTLAPPFRPRLIPIDPERLPLLRDLASRIPPGLRQRLLDAVMAMDRGRP